MESPKTGILLLALLAFTTVSGAFLGWSMRPKAAPAEQVSPATRSPVGVSGATIEIPLSAGTNSEKQPSSSQ
jgi:hypothetical protein